MKHQDKRIKAAELFDKGWSYRAVASHLNIHPNTIRSWMYAYRALGKEGLLSRNYKTYSQEDKLEAVRLFLEEGLPKSEVMQRMGIKSKSALEVWIRKYREGGPDALTPKQKGRKPKAKKQTYETREQELEAKVRELELELEIQKRINALIDEIEHK